MDQLSLILPKIDELDEENTMTEPNETGKLINAMKLQEEINLLNNTLTSYKRRLAISKNAIEVNNNNIRQLKDDLQKIKSKYDNTETQRKLNVILDMVKGIDKNVTKTTCVNEEPKIDKIDIKNENKSGKGEVKRALNFDIFDEEKLIPKFVERELEPGKMEIIIYYGSWSKLNTLIHCPICEHGPLSFEGVRKHLEQVHKYSSALVRKEIKNTD